MKTVFIQGRRVLIFQATFLTIAAVLSQAPPVYKGTVSAQTAPTAPTARSAPVARTAPTVKSTATAATAPSTATATTAPTAASAGTAGTASTAAYAPTVGAPAASAPATAQAAPANAVPPPAAGPKLSAAQLEQLLMPIALYPDPLLATVLPASVYPLEIVQAARFMANTNNLAKLDEQPWDESVKAVARIPDALKKLNDNLDWTIRLGEAFLNQDKDVMDTIQALRLKAQTAGTLQTTPQQTIVVTNMVVEKTVEQQVVVVTNTVVQIQPSNPQTVYVPSYPPTVYYPPPAYVYDPYAPLITFTAGVAMGAIIANNCDWHHGGCYWGGGGDVNIDIDRGDINIGSGNIDRGNRVNATSNKWQPDQNRIKTSGSPGSVKSMEARGWSSGTSAARGPSTRPSNVAGATRPSTPSAAARPSSGVSSRPAGGGGAVPGARPSTPTARPSTPSARPSPSVTPGASSRPGGTPGASVSQPSARSGNTSAFSGGGGSAQRQSSQRGMSSRSGGGGGGFSRGGGGGRR